MSVNVNTAIFNDKYIPLLTAKQRQIYLYGGSSSGKSNFIAHNMVLAMLRGEGCLVARRTQTSMRKSVFLEIKSAIHDMGLSDHIETKSSDLTFTSNLSVGSIQLVGCDNEDKLRSIKPINQTAFTKLWVEEADSVPLDLIIQLNLRMRGRPIGNYTKQSFYSFNPTFEENHIFKDLIDLTGFDKFKDWYYEDDDVIVMRTTYKDNKYLEQDEIDYLEELGNVSTYHRDVYLLALPGVLGERVFPVVHDRDEPPTGLDWEVRLGIDNGYTDYQTFVFSLYSRSLNEVVLVDSVKMKGVVDGKNYVTAIKAILTKHGISHRFPITADSNDPRMRKVLIGLGLNIARATKGAGSKFSGLIWMNTNKISVIKSAVDLKTAVQGYVWDPNKPGKTLHVHSDLMDAARYSFESIYLTTTTMFGRK